MRFVFFADCGSEVGAGHVMRSFAIAEELSLRGFTTLFLNLSKAPEWAKIKIAKLENCSISQLELSEFLPLPEKDFLILDSYQISPHDSKVAKSNWLAVAALIDEVTPDYEADLYIAPSLTIPAGRQNTYGGPEYLPVRNELISDRTKESGESSPLKVLLTGGGTDPYGFVEEALSVLIDIPIDFELIILTNRPQKELSRNFRVYPSGDYLKDVISIIDLAISPASTSSFEFIVNEIPLGIVSSADNQERNYQDLKNLGLAFPLGIRKRSGEWDLSAESFIKLIVDKNIRDGIKGAQHGAISKLGAFNSVDLILKQVSNKRGV